jgi:hypothetical protein
MKSSIWWMRFLITQPKTELKGMSRVLVLWCNIKNKTESRALLNEITGLSVKM